MMRLKKRRRKGMRRRKMKNQRLRMLERMKMMTLICLQMMMKRKKRQKRTKKIKEERLAAYHAKKATKTALIAKSSLLLDVKPWVDETDMAKVEELVRSVKCDGLVWGQSKLVPLAYGIKKLQIGAVIEDDKVSTDYLEEEITKFAEYVQSMDIAAFNKI